MLSPRIYNPLLCGKTRAGAGLSAGLPLPSAFAPGVRRLIWSARDAVAGDGPNHPPSEDRFRPLAQARGVRRSKRSTGPFCPLCEPLLTV